VSGGKGIADGEREFLVGVAALALVADDNGPAARHSDLDLDLKDRGLLRRALRRLDANAATGHAHELPGELGDFLAHALLDGVTFLNAVKMNLDRCIH
jgi:hypothetical protein